MKKRLLMNILSVLVLGIVIYTMMVILKLDILPGKYLKLLIIGEVVFYLLGLLLYNLKHKVFIVLGILLYLISIAGNGVAYYYCHKTNDYIEDNFVMNTYKATTPYYLVTGANNPVNDVSELSSDTSIGYYPVSTAVETAKKVLGDYQYNAIENEFYTLIGVRDNLTYYITPKEDFVFLLGASNAIDESMFKILKEFNVEEEFVVDDKVPTAFNVYISGLDYQGRNRDYNLIATVNMKTHKILLTSIPRDYYIDIPAYNAKDSLTTLGVVDSKIPKEGLECLFNTKIDYTLNIYTETLVKVVDTIGGVEFCSDKSYYTKHDTTIGSYDDYGEKVYVESGCHTYNGLQTLAIARERVNNRAGDRGRQENCRQIAANIIRKIASMDTITNYGETLNSFDGLYTTNINKKTITAFIKEGIDNPNFEIIEQGVDGIDGKTRNHWDTGDIWTVEPNMDQVNAASQKINEVLNEK